jgi:uncharacterized membrane protein YbjE (DUF340 family)
MFTEQEEKFIAYWETNRLTYKKSFKDFIKGFSKGLGISVAIILILVSGWYTRANMEANSKLSSVVFIIALLGIGVFMAWLSQNYKWEQNEQQYLELMAKKRRFELNKQETKSEEDIINQ